MLVSHGPRPSPSSSPWLCVLCGSVKFSRKRHFLEMVLPARQSPRAQDMMLWRCYRHEPGEWVHGDLSSTPS